MIEAAGVRDEVHVDDDAVPGGAANPLSDGALADKVRRFCAPRIGDDAAAALVRRFTTAPADAPFAGLIAPSEGAAGAPPDGAPRL